MAKRNDTDKLDALLASVTDDMLGDELPQQFHDDSKKVERILLDLVRPDPVQPRRVLPERIHYAFHSNKLTPSQALRELVQIAQVAARQRGRPFNNTLELLPDPDRDDEADTKLTPEEALLRDLVNLAVTIRDDGQVNPITVVDMTQGVSRLYRIETGERRYWAAWLLRDFLPSYDDDGMIDCIVMQPESASAFRQAKENTARAGLSAIAMARQAALLLLHVHGYPVPDGPVPPDFYRQALDLTLRGKREYSAEILAAMGGISTSLFSRYKALLRLSDEAFEVADRNNLDEGVLRHVIKLPPEDHVEMLQHIVQLGLTAKQAMELCSQDLPEIGLDAETLPRHTRQLVKLIKSLPSSTPDGLATALLRQEGDPHLARVRLQRLRQFIDAAERYLSAE